MTILTMFNRSFCYTGFVLYTGGFNAGLTALILVPILDFYKIKPKKIDDDEILEIKGHENGLLPKLVAISNRLDNKE